MVITESPFNTAETQGRRELRVLDALVRTFVWQKGDFVAGRDPAVWRRDVNGCLMRWSDYGKRWSRYGWELDQVPDVEIEAEQDFDLTYMRPLHNREDISIGEKVKGVLTNFFGGRVH